MKRLKIAIIGSGPAGAFSAYLLSSLGHEITIFEQKSSIKRKVCGEYLCPMGVEVLKKHGLDKLVLNGFQTLNGMVLVDVKNQEVIKAHFPKLSTHSMGVSVNRQRFDQALLDLALNNGVKVQFDHRLLHLENKKNQWNLEFETSNELGSKIFTQAFDFLIAADGRNSHISKTLHHSPKSNTDRMAIHCYLPRKSDHGLRLGEMHIFEDGSYCGLNPVADDQVNFSIVIDSHIIKNKNQLIPEMNKRIQQSQRLSKLFDLIPEGIEVKTSMPLSHKNSYVAGKQLAYVGDASGFIDPLTGEGMANALLSADLLYQAMVENENLSTALQEYRSNRISILRQKYVLNTIFQTVIRKPMLVTLMANFLKTNQNRANIFIGIIGNIFTPIEGFFKFFQKA